MTKLKTIADVARTFSVSIRTAERWSSYADWPGRSSDGTFSFRAVNAFLRRRKLGPHNSHSDRDELTEARRVKTIEHAENLRITNERLRATQQRELANIISSADIKRFREQTRAVLTKVYDDAISEIGRVSEGFPEEVRGRLLTIVRKIASDAFAVMEEGQP